VYKEEKDVEKTKGKESKDERKKEETYNKTNKLPLTSKGRKNEPLSQIVAFLLMTLLFL
jgi:hypothetical protein